MFFVWTDMVEERQLSVLVWQDEAHKIVFLVG